MFELLAPAGSQECFFAAVNNGADAVYMGLTNFSARKNAANFTAENLPYFVAYAHTLGVKVYVAVNTLVKNAELGDFLATVGAAYSAGADAFILQDVFLCGLLKSKFPDIVLHLSTQGGVNNVEGAKFALRQGVSRVILARETAAEDVKRIAEIVETEIFVHGALCSSFSGHCYMSSFVGGNSGNRGLCKQPCRRAYELENSETKGKYAISLSDLCLIEKLDELKKLGVSSVKIEGRMRTSEYVAATVKAYRQAINGCSYDLSEISETFNRGDFTRGYTFGVKKDLISDKIQNHKGNKVGRVEKILDKERILVTSERVFLNGDGFKIIRNECETGNAVCRSDGKILFYKGNVQIGDDVNITKDESLSLKFAVAAAKKLVEISVYAKEGEKLRASCGRIEAESATVCETAKTRAIEVKDLVDNFSKTDVYPFLPNVKATVEGKPFIVKSALNAVRAKLYERLFYGNVNVDKICDYSYDLPKIEMKNKFDKIILSDKLIETKENTALVIFPNDYDALSGDFTSAYLYVPSFLSNVEIAKIKDLSLKFKGFYVDGLCGLQLASELNKPFIAGVGLNAFNSFAVKGLYELGADAVVFSKELSIKEIIGISDAGFVFNRGNIRLMELEYCPYGMNCKMCDRGNLNELKDELGHKFTVRRYKIGGKCHFEVYNEKILNFPLSDYGYGELVNLVGLKGEAIKRISERGFTGETERYYGNLKKGVY